MWFQIIVVQKCLPTMPLDLFLEYDPLFHCCATVGVASRGQTLQPVRCSSLMLKCEEHLIMERTVTAVTLLILFRILVAWRRGSKAVMSVSACHPRHALYEVYVCLADLSHSYLQLFWWYVDPKHYSWQGDKYTEIWPSFVMDLGCGLACLAQASSVAVVT